MDSKSLPERAHPVGEVKNESISHDKVSAGASALPVDTGTGHYRVQWDDSAPVTPLEAIGVLRAVSARRWEMEGFLQRCAIWIHKPECSNS